MKKKKDQYVLFSISIFKSKTSKVQQYYCTRKLMIKKYFYIKIIRIDTCTSKHTYVFNFTFHVFLIHAIDFVNHLVFAKARRRVREVIFIRKSCYICRNGRTVITHCFTGNVKVKFKMSTGIKMIESKVRSLNDFTFTRRLLYLF